LGAGIDVFSSQTGLLCPSTKISLGTLPYAAIDTDAAGNLYVGLDQYYPYSAAPYLMVFKPGGTALIGMYPYGYDTYTVPGTVWVR
jgi:hypothetical protein